MQVLPQAQNQPKRENSIPPEYKKGALTIKRTFLEIKGRERLYRLERNRVDCDTDSMIKLMNDIARVCRARGDMESAFGHDLEAAGLFRKASELFGKRRILNPELVAECAIEAAVHFERAAERYDIGTAKWAKAMHNAGEMYDRAAHNGFLAQADSLKLAGLHPDEEALKDGLNKLATAASAKAIRCYEESGGNLDRAGQLYGELSWSAPSVLRLNPASLNLLPSAGQDNVSAESVTAPTAEATTQLVPELHGAPTTVQALKILSGMMEKQMREVSASGAHRICDKVIEICEHILAHKIAPESRSEAAKVLSIGASCCEQFRDDGKYMLSAGKFAENAGDICMELGEFRSAMFCYTKSEVAYNAARDMQSSERAKKRESTARAAYIKTEAESSGNPRANGNGAESQQSTAGGAESQLQTPSDAAKLLP